MKTIISTIINDGVSYFKADDLILLLYRYKKSLSTEVKKRVVDQIINEFEKLKSEEIESE